MTREGNDTYGVVKRKILIEEDHYVSTAPSSHFTVDYAEDS